MGSLGCRVVCGFEKLPTGKNGDGGGRRSQKGWPVKTRRTDRIAKGLFKGPRLIRTALATRAHNSLPELLPAMGLGLESLEYKRHRDY